MEGCMTVFVLVILMQLPGGAWRADEVARYASLDECGMYGELALLSPRKPAGYMCLPVQEGK
jgi:hypothetical protein